MCNKSENDKTSYVGIFEDELVSLIFIEVGFWQIYFSFAGFGILMIPEKG